MKPIGIRRILRFLPYLTGQAVNLEITLKTISGESREFLHTIKCYFVSSDRILKQINHEERLIQQTDNMIQTKLSIPFITTSGNYSIELALSYRGMTSIEAIVDLHAMSKDLLIAKSFFIAMPLIIGGVIGWLLGQNSHNKHKCITTNQMQIIPYFLRVDKSRAMG